MHGLVGVHAVNLWVVGAGVLACTHLVLVSLSQWPSLSSTLIGLPQLLLAMWLHSEQARMLTAMLQVQ